MVGGISLLAAPSITLYISHMNFFDFIKQEELDDAPEDPALAFTYLVTIAQRRLSEETKSLNGEDQYSYQVLEEARHGFMNVVIALAKVYKVEPFASLEVPRHQEFGSGVHRQFKLDLDHYMTQLLVSNSIRGRQDSVLIPPKMKDKIRSYIHGLKQAIDQSELSDAKRSALHAKLAEFEKELEKSRLTLIAVTRITIAILAVPGSLWASYELVQKLANNVLQTVGEAKVADDENRQLAPAPPRAALSPPRKEDGFPQAKQGDDLDDEIPF